MRHSHFSRSCGNGPPCPASLGGSTVMTQRVTSVRRFEDRDGGQTTIGYRPTMTRADVLHDISGCLCRRLGASELKQVTCLSVQGTTFEHNRRNWAEFFAGRRQFHRCDIQNTEHEPLHPASRAATRDSPLADQSANSACQCPVGDEDAARPSHALDRLFAMPEDVVSLTPTHRPVVAPAPQISTWSCADENAETLVPHCVPAGAAGEALLQGLPEKFGRYRIVQPLGSGAMGTVYLAEDSQLHRRVALKTPRFERDQTGERLERFYQEARLAAVLRHPNICPVFDVGEINGRHYISMAYIEGQPLSASTWQDQPHPERRALVLIRKLALALQEAHDHGIIHRDLKPGNVMLDRKDEPIVTDFGLARAVEPDDASPLTRRGMLLGSPAYMSPEQVEGVPSKLSPATDQYSLGVMLYELLTGSVPFQGSMTAVLYAILTKAPATPSATRPGLDPNIDALCLKMMAKSPTDRFPSMAVVADTIAEILESESARSTDGSDSVAPNMSALQAARNAQRQPSKSQTRLGDVLPEVRPGTDKSLWVKKELNRNGSGRMSNNRGIGKGSWLPWLPLTVGAVSVGLTLLAVNLRWNRIMPATS